MLNAQYNSASEHLTDNFPSEYLYSSIPYWQCTVHNTQVPVKAMGPGFRIRILEYLSSVAHVLLHIWFIIVSWSLK